MDQAVRRFARNILLIHVVLLVALLGAVYFAAQSIERTARNQALAQAQSRQELLTSQTARGIENFYRGILDDMDLLPRADDDKTFPPQMVRPATQRVRPGRSSSTTNPAPTPAQRTMGTLLGRQLEDRASRLFILDVPRRAILRSIITADAEAGATPQRVIEAYGPWLNDLKTPSVSTFKIVGGEGINIVCMPLPQNRAAVAVVPVLRVNEEFIATLNEFQQSAACLLDHSLNVMAASRASIVGSNLGEAGDSNIKRLVTADQHQGKGQAAVFKEGSSVGTQQFPPALVTTRPIDVVPGRPWTILIASPLQEIDRIVSGMFDRIFWGAACVMLAITAILISTGVQMIRSRMRTETIRRQVLERELNGARQIQLAWLPQGRMSHRSIDLAAVNQPASHVSGDFYNWFELPDKRIAVVIGDVTGHGIAAAFLMATTQLLVRNTLPGAGSPGACLELVNRQLCVQVFNGQFVTMQIVVIDPHSGLMEVATAGHPAPMICSGCTVGDESHPETGTRPFTPLPIEPQLVLGVDPDTAFPTEQFPLPPGGSVLLYTDGVTELEGQAGTRLYGKGLQEQLGGDAHATAEGLLDHLVKSLTRFRGTRTLVDDLTIVAIRFSAEPAVIREMETVE